MDFVNWKTTVGGLLIAIGQAAPAIPGVPVFVGPLLTAIGGALLGYQAKDKAQTGSF